MQADDLNMYDIVGGELVYISMFTHLIHAAYLNNNKKIII